jgi:hypothetical protein
MIGTVDQFVKQADSKCRQIMDELDRAKEPPEQLSHFTNTEGFIGVVSSRGQWSSTLRKPSVVWRSLETS